MGFFSKKSLGIDIGVSSIKIVEVSATGKRKKLENYVEFRFPDADEGDKGNFFAFDKETLLLASDNVAEVLSGLFEKTGIRQKKAAFSIPDFSTFFTTFTLPAMTQSEIPQAVKFEARHHIPIPLSDVTFDWKIIGQRETAPGVKLNILLVAVPNKVLESYQRLATLCQLDLKGMEAEVFGLVRSAIPAEKESDCVGLVDFGWQSTTVSIVENKNLKMSYSFDISGTGLTKALSDELGVDLMAAEKMKKQYGLDPKKPEVAKVLTDKINYLAEEIGRVCDNFQQTEGREVKNLVLIGGTASLFGLKEYLTSRLKKSVAEADPFSKVSYPASLKKRLNQIGPAFAVALGVGMMGAEV